MAVTEDQLPKHNWPAIKAVMTAEQMGTEEIRPILDVLFPAEFDRKKLFTENEVRHAMNKAGYGTKQIQTMMMRLSGVKESLAEKLGSYQYKLPPDKEQMLYDFYMLSLMSSTGDEDLDSALQDTKERLYPELKQELLKAVTYSITAEMRHILDYDDPQRVLSLVEKKLGPDYAKQLRRYLKDYTVRKKLPGLTREPRAGKDRSVMGKGANYDASYKSALRAFKTPDRIAQVAEVLFSKGKWGGSYGGKPWRAIASAWQNLNDATKHGEMQKWIDHVYDLQHNTDTVFNKVKSYSKDGRYKWIGKALDKKAAVRSPYATFDDISPQMKRLAGFLIHKNYGTSLEQWAKERDKKLQEPDKGTPLDNWTIHQVASYLELDSSMERMLKRIADTEKLELTEPYRYISDQLGKYDVERIETMYDMWKSGSKKEPASKKKSKSKKSKALLDTGKELADQEIRALWDTLSMSQNTEGNIGDVLHSSPYGSLNILAVIWPELKKAAQDELKTLWKEYKVKELEREEEVDTDVIALKKWTIDAVKKSLAPSPAASSELNVASEKAGVDQEAFWISNIWDDLSNPVKVELLALYDKQRVNKKSDTEDQLSDMTVETAIETLPLPGWVSIAIEELMSAGKMTFDDVVGKVWWEFPASVASALNSAFNKQKEVGSKTADFMKKTELNMQNLKKSNTVKADDELMSWKVKDAIESLNLPSPIVKVLQKDAFVTGTLGQVWKALPSSVRYNLKINYDTWLRHVDQAKPVRKKSAKKKGFKPDPGSLVSEWTIDQLLSHLDLTPQMKKEIATGMQTASVGPSAPMSSIALAVPLRTQEEIGKLALAWSMKKQKEQDRRNESITEEPFVVDAEHIVDLNFDRLPMRREEVKKLKQSFDDGIGVVGLRGDQWMYIGPDGIRPAVKRERFILPKLPDSWEEHTVIENATAGSNIKAGMSVKVTGGEHHRGDIGIVKSTRQMRHGGPHDIVVVKFSDGSDGELWMRDLTAVATENDKTEDTFTSAVAVTDVIPITKNKKKKVKLPGLKTSKRKKKRQKGSMRVMHAMGEGDRFMTRKEPMKEPWKAWIHNYDPPVFSFDAGSFKPELVAGIKAAIEEVAEVVGVKDWEHGGDVSWYVTVADEEDLNEQILLQIVNAARRAEGRSEVTGFDKHGSMIAKPIGEGITLRQDKITFTARPEEVVALEDMPEWGQLKQLGVIETAPFKVPGQEEDFFSVTVDTTADGWSNADMAALLDQVGQVSTAIRGKLEEEDEEKPAEQPVGPSKCPHCKSTHIEKGICQNCHRGIGMKTPKPRREESFSTTGQAVVNETAGELEIMPETAYKCGVCGKTAKVQDGIPPICKSCAIEMLPTEILKDPEEVKVDDAEKFNKEEAKESTIKEEQYPQVMWVSYGRGGWKEITIKSEREEDRIIAKADAGGGRYTFTNPTVKKGAATPDDEPDTEESLSSKGYGLEPSNPAVFTGEAVEEKWVIVRKSDGKAMNGDTYDTADEAHDAFEDLGDDRKAYEVVELKEGLCLGMGHRQVLKEIISSRNWSPKQMFQMFITQSGGTGKWVTREVVGHEGAGPKSELLYRTAEGKVARLKHDLVDDAQGFKAVIGPGGQFKESTVFRIGQVITLKNTKYKVIKITERMLKLHKKGWPKGQGTEMLKHQVSEMLEYTDGGSAVAPTATDPNMDQHVQRLERDAVFAQALLKYQRSKTPQDWEEVRRAAERAIGTGGPDLAAVLGRYAAVKEAVEDKSFPEKSWEDRYSTDTPFRVPDGHGGFFVVTDGSRAGTTVLRVSKELTKDPEFKDAEDRMQIKFLSDSPHGTKEDTMEMMQAQMSLPAEFDPNETDVIVAYTANPESSNPRDPQEHEPANIEIVAVTREDTGQEIQVPPEVEAQFEQEILSQLAAREESSDTPAALATKSRAAADVEADAEAAYESARVAGAKPDEVTRVFIETDVGDADKVVEVLKSAGYSSAYATGGGGSNNGGKEFKNVIALISPAMDPEKAVAATKEILTKKGIQVTENMISLKKPEVDPNALTDQDYAHLNEMLTDKEFTRLIGRYKTIKHDRYLVQAARRGVRLTGLCEKEARILLEKFLK